MSFLGHLLRFSNPQCCAYSCLKMPSQKPRSATTIRTGPLEAKSPSLTQSSLHYNVSFPVCHTADRSRAPPDSIYSLYLYRKPPSALSAKIFISFFCLRNTILASASPPFLFKKRKELSSTCFSSPSLFTKHFWVRYVMLTGSLWGVEDWTVLPLNR